MPRDDNEWQHVQRFDVYERKPKSRNITLDTSKALFIGGFLVLVFGLLIGLELSNNDDPVSSTPEVSPVADPTATTVPGPSPTPQVPDVVQNVSIQPLDGAVRVNWSAPVSNGASPVMRYIVTLLPGGKEVTIQGGSSQSAVVDGLQNGTAYTAEVYAVNLVGNGDASTANNSAVPGARQELSLASEQVTVAGNTNCARTAVVDFSAAIWDELDVTASAGALVTIAVEDPTGTVVASSGASDSHYLQITTSSSGNHSVVVTAAFSPNPIRSCVSWNTTANVVVSAVRYSG